MLVALWHIWICSLFIDMSHHLLLYIRYADTKMMIITT